MSLRAAIVGLGQVGMLFDADPNRRRTWTHFSAYEQLTDRFELVAVCDPDPDRCRRAAERLPAVRTFATLDDLLRAESLDIVSLCTPIAIHAEQVKACAGRTRAIVCEKPLSANLASAEAAVGSCATSGTLLAVNYYKRFEGVVQEAARLIGDGALGAVHTATAMYAGPLDAVGSHAVDLLHFLLGPLEVTAVAGESALLRFGDGGVAALMATGPRADLVFEIDLIGSEGRARITDNCERLEVARFAKSTRYAGYRELARAEDDVHAASDPFLSLFAELADALDGSRQPLTSDGASALATQRVLDKIELDAARL